MYPTIYGSDAHLLMLHHALSCPSFIFPQRSFNLSILVCGIGVHGAAPWRYIKLYTRHTQLLSGTGPFFGILPAFLFL